LPAVRAGVYKRSMRLVFCSLALAASACSLTQAVEQGSRSLVATTVDEIGKGISHVGSNVRGQNQQQPQQTPPPQQQAQQPQQQQVVATASTAPQGRQTKALFAVLEFKNRIKGKDAEGVDAVYFANAVRSAVKRTAPQARVMTRENVMVLLQSQGKSLSDCEGECEVDTGRALGADMVVSGDLIKIGSTFKLDLRMHQTSDGQLISGAAASGKSPDDLDTDAARAVAELLAPLP
jgi:hypothetical protein